MPTENPHVRLYQIAYSEDTWNGVAPGFFALDNRANARPDWAEYWPIRNFLLNEKLDEDTLYGFLSPRFAEKLYCSADDILHFVGELDPATELASFSPYFDFQAAFLNPFEQGEFFHPGLMQTCALAVKEILPQVDLKTLQCRVAQTIFCNYFAAKPGFWRKWLGICERIYAMAESPSHALHAALTRPYAHREGNQAKVFVIERMVSLLLATEDDIEIARFPQSSLSDSFTQTDPEVFEQLSREKSAACDGNREALSRYRTIQGKVLASPEAVQVRAHLVAHSVDRGMVHAPSPGYEHWGGASLRMLYAQGQISLWQMLAGSLRGNRSWPVN